MVDPGSPDLPAGPFLFSPEALFRYQVVSQVVADVRAGKPLAQGAGRRSRPSRSRPGGELLVGTDDAELALWDLAGGRRLGPPGGRAHGGPNLRSLAVAPDGSFGVGGAMLGILHFVDLASAE